MSDYPKVIDTGGIRVTVRNAKEEARWRSPVTTSAPVQTVEITPEPVEHTPSEPVSVVVETPDAAPVQDDPKPQTYGKQKQAAKQAAHKGDKKK